MEHFINNSIFSLLSCEAPDETDAKKSSSAISEDEENDDDAENEDEDADENADTDEEKSSESKNNDNNEELGFALEANPLAPAYPGGLAIAVFPQTQLIELTNNASSRSLKKKKEEQEQILSGKGSCLGLVFSQQQPEHSEPVSCYEFDQEMMYGQNYSGNFYGTLDGTDSNGEACLVAFARNQVEVVEQMVDRSLGLMQAMLCQAKRSNNR